MRALGDVGAAVQDGSVKYSTAVERLRACATDFDRLAGLSGEPLLQEAWVFGELLDGPDQLDVVPLALVVDLPPEQVPWLTRPPAAEAVTSFLRFEKYPLRWFWRPAMRPVWNHAIRRAVRFWSSTGGPEVGALDALGHRGLDKVAVVAPPDGDALADQLRVEHNAARAHLSEVVERFHDLEWRRDHKGSGLYPDDHLWSAAKGFLDLDAAIREHG